MSQGPDLKKESPSPPASPGQKTGFSPLRWFKPPPPIARRSGEDTTRFYPRFRWRVFEAAFIAYATFYIVRNNFAPVSKEIGAALGYDKLMIGDILAATAIAYGFGKFIMGFFSDRSDPRKYLFIGMSLTAFLNFAFGSAASYKTHLLLWTLNGFVQGMGYAPCTRGLAHWYSIKERGLIFGFWNMSHNIGGAIAGVLAAYCAHEFGWPSAFFVPGVIASVCAVYLFWRMRDTPQSVGLPSIEEYKGEYPPEETELHEKELTTREILVDCVLKNKWLWLIAIANFFVYIARYSMLDWGPTYLKEIKGASLKEGGFSTAVIELAGAAGMLTMGWFSDRIGGRRGLVSAVAMIPVVMAFAAIPFTPKGMLWLDMILFAIIGFFVYTPVMALGVMSLDLTSKKAVGTAAGFVGFFGYMGRVAQGKGLGWIVHHHDWNTGLYAIVGCAAAAIVLLAFTWNVRPKG